MNAKFTIAQLAIKVTTVTNRFLWVCFLGALVMVVAVTTTTPHSYGQNRLGVQMGDPPANPRASADAQAVLAYLQAQRTNCAILAGQNVKSGEGMAEDYAEVVAGLHATTGQWVGLLGMDYYDYDDDHADYAESNPILIDYWQAGGLVSLSWSIPNPWTGGDAWDTRNADLTELLDPNAPAHGVWMAHLDNMADALTALRNAGVVVLWRPLHEMNGDWFWWGSGSHPSTPAPYQALWRQMFDYFTVTRGLDNLLWVYSAAGEEPWDTRPAADFYYPGNAYVDVVGQSVYSGTLDQFHIYSYDRLLSLGKPVALAEFGPGLTWMGPQDGDYDYLILLERLRNRYPQTVYWLSWHDWAEDGVPVYMSIAKNLNATALMNDSCVTTRDEVDWHSYLAPTPTRTPTPPSSGAATLFYTEQPPTVDGQLDSLWASAVPYTIGKSILGKMPTQTDLSASFKALYDQDTFYLFVDIPDDLLVQDSVSQWWEDDAVEIYLDGNLSRGQTYDGVDDYLLILRWNDATVYVGADSVPAPADLEWAYRQTDSGWAVEIAFPWSALGITAQPGIQFGYDVHVSDDDDGGDAREHKLAWHADRDDAWYNPSLLGLAELADKQFTVNLPLVLTHTAQATPAIPVPPTSTPTQFCRCALLLEGAYTKRP